MNIGYLLALTITAGGTLYAAQSIESMYVQSQKLFTQPGKTAAKPVQQDWLEQRDPKMGPVVDNAPLRQLPRGTVLAAPVGKVALAPQLDRQLTMLQPKLGANPWHIGAAANPAADGFFITFMPLSKDRVVVEQMSFDRLKGNGQIVVLDEKTQYRIRLVPNLFDPVRGSTIYLDPAAGTQGPSYKYKTGQLLDLTKSHSYVFKAGGREYWFLYGTDIDEKNKKFAETRHYAFIREAGMNTVVRTAAEAAVETGHPYEVMIGDAKIMIVRNQAGELEFFE